MSRQTTKMSGIALLATSIVASAAAQILLKAGMLSLQQQGFATEAYREGFMQALGTPVIWWVLGGFTCYAISMLAWLGVLARFALSFAYPFLSLSFILVYLVAMAWPLLDEPLSLTRLVGILLVVAGVMLVAVSGTSDPSVAAKES